jgi:hypothetical protein
MQLGADFMVLLSGVVHGGAPLAGIADWCARHHTALHGPGASFALRTAVQEALGIEGSAQRGLITERDARARLRALEERLGQSSTG